MEDYSVLKYSTYAEYLASFPRTEDHRYLQDVVTIDKLIKLGYHSITTVYDEDEFYRAKLVMESSAAPKVTSITIYSIYLTGDDEVLKALAMREKANVLQEISTIIYMQVRRRNGFDISGYIDYEMSLRQANMRLAGATDWRAIFEGHKLLSPRITDLGFYNWRTGEVFDTSNDNYQVVSHPVYGMYFMHKGDHKIIPVTTKPNPFAENVTRTVFKSPLYDFVVLYDHGVRKKI
ncbi:cilia- and flagella-associated protein 299-like [Drosophila tropicalis]|uniref:cilia- and flagella-associated protein 299-like n=1 Tax=Drosophila tropicalis TaxID=46794 RepID=UPI0035ABFD1D